MKIKNVYVIAGPNGTGKTTFANKFFADTWMLFDNSKIEPSLIAKETDGSLKVFEKQIYELILKKGR